MIPVLKLTVHYTNGGVSTVEAKPRSQVAFEQKFNMPLSQAFSNELGTRFEHLYYLAWHASKAGQEFAAWLDEVENIDIEVEAADPTTATPSDGK